MKPYSFVLSIESEKPDGECTIILTSTYPGREDEVRTWVTPDILDALFIAKRAFKGLHDGMGNQNLQSTESKMMVIPGSLIQGVLGQVFGHLGLPIPGQDDDPLAPTEEDKKKVKEFVDEVSKV